jgi:hypothetical protein
VAIPKGIKNLHVSVDVRPQLVFGDELFWRFFDVNDRGLRDKMMEQAVGSHFTSPIGMIRLEIHTLGPALPLRSESSYIQLWPQNRGIDGNPFLHKPLRVEESSVRRARAHLVLLPPDPVKNAA